MTSTAGDRATLLAQNSAGLFVSVAALAADSHIQLAGVPTVSNGVTNRLKVQIRIESTGAVLVGMDISVPTANVICQMHNYRGVHEVVAEASGPVTDTAIFDVNAVKDWRVIYAVAIH